MNRREFLGAVGTSAAMTALTISSKPAFEAKKISIEYPWQIGPFVRPANGNPIVILNR